MNTATLATLDNSLYPQVWQQQTFTDAQSLLMALLTGDICLDANAFTTQLMANDSYQQWINATVFGSYIQRNFAAFYQQTEDSFNSEMPALFRQELMRYAQYLPEQQVLFVAGDILKNVRTEKLLTTTINPVTVIANAQKINQRALASGRAKQPQLIVNQLTVMSRQVQGFAMRHNKRTSARTRNEVLILDFKELRLLKECIIENSKIADTILLRYYELR